MSVPTMPGFVVSRYQAGNSLIIVLVVLTLLSLAGFGAMRSADTGNVISGNFAFQQAATQASDRAVTDALNALAVIAAGGTGNNDIPNRYASVRTNALDARGVPTTINWSSVACTDETGVAVADCDADNGNFRIQYFVERLCSAAPDMTVISDIRAKCEFEPGPGANAATATPATIPLRYRVLIRVRGPRGTEGWYETLLSGPATV